MNSNNFGDDILFLKEKIEVIVLTNSNETSSVAISPELQARVLTSSSNGNLGKSYGWLNYDLIDVKNWQPHINAFGGEDRFWLAPEAGQFSIYFKPGDAFEFKNWQTPECIDSERFDLVSIEKTKAVFKKLMQVTNYQNINFKVLINRTIDLFEISEIENNLNISIPKDLKVVGFQSENNLTNKSEDWKFNSGLLSIWILGMFNSSPQTTALIPTSSPKEINTKYFGAIKDEKIKLEKDYVALTVDGLEKYKIGVLPKDAKNVFGSYDKDNNILTIVKYSLKKDGIYLNSLWKNQQNPYLGDVINVYNDGPNDDGSILGPYFELESSSDSKELRQEETISHVHQTYHFEGTKTALNEISKSVLNIDLNQLQ